MSYFREGDFNTICERSGFKCKRSDCRKEWDGRLVYKLFWRPRHPQDIPAKMPKPSIPTDGSVPVFTYVSTNQITAEDL